MQTLVQRNNIISQVRYCSDALEGKKVIEGVVIKNLKTHKDKRGFFREIFCFSTEFRDISVEQLSHSLVNEGVVKAWHAHKFQSQWNYVVSGLVKVVLIDDRPHSPTYKEIMEFKIGALEEPLAYFFPPYVLHGYKCLEGPVHIIYVTSGIYDLTDELRLQCDDSKISYKWHQ